MSITAEQLSALIRQRRSIFPNSYNDKPIPEAIVREVLENANWAPTHKLTEPWRFKVFQAAGLARLGDYLADWYQAHTPADKYSEKKQAKMRENPMRSACVIAIVMQREAAESLPEWEEVAAVACAVQNMWLTCTAHGIGSYWSTPRAILEADAFLGLQEGERCLGLFYMGYHDLPELPGKRGDIWEKVEWIGR
jgi:nitroreductase